MYNSQLFVKRTLDITIGLLILGLGLFFFHIVRTNSSLQEKVRQQELHANILIQEVGETKEENQALFEKLAEAEKAIEDVKNKIFLKEGETAPALTEQEVAAPKVPRPKEAAPPTEPTVVIPATRNFLVVGHNRRLADTIMIAAVNPVPGKITLVSIPRDLFVNGRKINEYLSLYGAETLRQKVSDVSGLSLDGYVIVNFEAFERLIDALGGIDVYSDKAIYDPAYPNGRGGYIVYSLAAGSHHLDGAQALKFARSRHSTSDFDRAARQQKIIAAVQERLLNLDFLANLENLRQIYASLQGAIETNLGIDDILNYLQTYRNYQLVSGNVLSTQNYLYSSKNIAGQYILLPRSGNFAAIQTYVMEMVK